MKTHPPSRTSQQATSYESRSEKPISRGEPQKIATARDSKSRLILGCGQLGHALLKIWPDAPWTSRSSKPGAVVFDWHQKSTWPNLPSADVAVITFPLSNLSTLQEFLKTSASQFKIIIVIGSTSRYIVPDNDTANEDSPLDLIQERVELEEIFKNHGARLVVSSGIVSENKTPKTWLQKGLIRDPQALVNLIHVEDLATAVDVVARCGQNGEAYIANTLTVRWSDLAKKLLSENEFEKFMQQNPTPKKSKKLDSSKLKNLGWKPGKLENSIF